MSDTDQLIDAYASGAALLDASLQNATDDHYDQRPIEGKWSIREVVCHLADAEIVYADRIKRVLAEDNPTFFEADPDQFRDGLHSQDRRIEVELNVIQVVREHMLPILRSLSYEDFQRKGQHSLDGTMTLETLLKRITGHIPHHARFIDEKIAAMTA